jgi:hypothetical protein
MIIPSRKAVRYSDQSGPTITNNYYIRTKYLGPLGDDHIITLRAPRSPVLRGFRQGGGDRNR